MVVDERRRTLTGIVSELYSGNEGSYLLCEMGTQNLSGVDNGSAIELDKMFVPGSSHRITRQRFPPAFLPWILGYRFVVGGRWCQG